MLAVRSAWYGKDSRRACAREGGWLSNARGVAVGCHGHGNVTFLKRIAILRSQSIQYVGEGEKLVRSVFSLARRLSPCVVFIDEIDALFGARMGARESGGAIAHRGVITEFMQEMDGLKSSKDDNIIVIGATNRPFDLDDAVLRRLPRRLLVDLPGEKEREGMPRLKGFDLAHETNIPCRNSQNPSSRRAVGRGR